MLIGGDEIPEIIECMDRGSLHVHAPTTLIFTCGGQLDIAAAIPSSLREAFLRKAHQDSFYSKYEILKAEELNPFFPNGDYQDILKLESDIAQISDLILLFSESYGSAAELGAFSMVPEISSRLLVVIDDKNFNDKSFIALGPIRSLLNSHGGRSVCVLNRRQFGILSLSDLTNLTINDFHETVKAAIVERSKDFYRPSTFNKSLVGHVIKLIVGLIQHYGALTYDELNIFLYCLDLEGHLERIEDYLLCAQFAKWIKKDTRGINTYFASTANRPAINFRLKEGIPVINRTRWRALIREYWSQQDKNRFQCISDAIAGAAR